MLHPCRGLPIPLAGCIHGIGRSSVYGVQPPVCFFVVCPSDGDVAQFALGLDLFAIPVHGGAGSLQPQVQPLQ